MDDKRLLLLKQRRSLNNKILTNHLIAVGPLINYPEKFSTIISKSPLSHSTQNINLEHKSAHMKEVHAIILNKKMYKNQHKYKATHMYLYKVHKKKYE